MVVAISFIVVKIGDNLNVQKQGTGQIKYEFTNKVCRKVLHNPIFAEKENQELESERERMKGNTSI